MVRGVDGDRDGEGGDNECFLIVSSVRCGREPLGVAVRGEDHRPVKKVMATI